MVPLIGSPLAHAEAGAPGPALSGTLIPKSSLPPLPYVVLSHGDGQPGHQVCCPQSFSQGMMVVMAFPKYHLWLQRQNHEETAEDWVGLDWS